MATASQIKAMAMVSILRILNSFDRFSSPEEQHEPCHMKETEDFRHFGTGLLGSSLFARGHLRPPANTSCPVADALGTIIVCRTAQL
jgi:hypothetical protein